MFDYVLNFGLATQPLLLLLVGAAYFLVYYAAFRFCIFRFDLKTPGRDAEPVAAPNVSASSNGQAADIARALGGIANLEAIDACTTRLRLRLADPALIDERVLKACGARGIVRPGGNAVQVVLGPVADRIAGEMRSLSREQPTRPPVDAAWIAALGGSDNILDIAVGERRLRARNHESGPDRRIRNREHRSARLARSCSGNSTPADPLMRVASAQVRSKGTIAAPTSPFVVTSRERLRRYVSKAVWKDRGPLPVRKLRIAVVAHLRHPIATPFMGGMEAHCHQLVRVLVKRGHDVTLFASADSDPALPLTGTTERHYEAVLPWSRWHGTATLAAFQDAAFARAWRMIAVGGFDVVHNNAMYPPIHEWAARDRQPMVTSLHVPPFAGLAEAVDRHAAPWMRQTATSLNHLRNWWPHPPDTASLVHNGIDTIRWRYHPAGNGRAVWCGRITPNKGTGIAVLAARAAGIALDIYGPIDCRTYFEKEVCPLLDDARVYHGHIGGDALVGAIGSASVLLSTPMWDEPFGLVAAEAMACGVPVAAIDRGALREVVGDAGAFAYATTVPDVAAAIGRALLVPREMCRARVMRYFSVDAMLDGYETAYSAAIAARSSSSASTVAVLA